MTNIKALLEKLERKEKLPSPVLADLKQQGYIEVSDASTHDTPAGTRDYVFTFFTEKARKVMGR
jgi:hypothetical protein